MTTSHTHRAQYCISAIGIFFHALATKWSAETRNRVSRIVITETVSHGRMRASANQRVIARNNRLLRTITAARRQCRRSALTLFSPRAEKYFLVEIYTYTYTYCTLQCFFSSTLCERTFVPSYESTKVRKYFQSTKVLLFIYVYNVVHVVVHVKQLTFVLGSFFCTRVSC